MGSALPSTVIAGKYRLSRLLGEGGMGQVWLAENVVLHKHVALKLVSGAASAELVERFLREAALASRVSHPAIIDIHDAGLDDGVPWMAMELLEGESLADRIARRPLSLSEVSELLMPIVDALGALHAVGIVHRDLKPDNIFLEALPNGATQPKLLDFGIAKQLAISGLTKTGEMIGTGHYLSPEQAKGARDLDARSDLYSMGVVLFEALSGRTPYEAESLTELIAKLFTEPPRSLRALQPSVPESVARVVHRCLAREPAARPHDAPTLQRMWREATAASRPSALPPTQVMPAQALARTVAAPMPPPIPPRRQPVFDTRRLVARAWALAAQAFLLLSTITAVAIVADAMHLSAQRARPVAPHLAPHAAPPPPPPSAPHLAPPPNPSPPPVRPAQVACAAADPAQRATSVVRTGESLVRGPRSREQVRRVQRAAVPAVRVCHQAALTLCADVAGRVSVDLRIDEAGDVVESTLGSSTLDDGERVEGCMLSVLQRVHFPPAEVETRVQLAFVLDHEAHASRAPLAAPRGEAACEEGALSVAVSPYDASVYVDDQLRMDLLHGGIGTLCSGPHVVRVEPSRTDRRTYASVTRHIVVPSGGPVGIVVGLPRR